MKKLNKFTIILALITAFTFWLQFSASGLAFGAGEGNP
jgi:hypothetical protein